MKAINKSLIVTALLSGVACFSLVSNATELEPSNSAVSSEIQHKQTQENATPLLFVPNMNQDVPVQIICRDFPFCQDYDYTSDGSQPDTLLNDTERKQDATNKV